MIIHSSFFFFFFFNDTATTEIYTLSLHDALPISSGGLRHLAGLDAAGAREHALHLAVHHGADLLEDRKSTRLNSSHLVISYAVFCLKKKKKKKNNSTYISFIDICHPYLHMTYTTL